MDAAHWISDLRQDEAFMRHVVVWRESPPRVADFGDWPSWLHNDLKHALLRRGIERPYRHQALAWEAVHQNRHTVIVTPTASGKSLCFQVPVLQAVLTDPHARSLLMFPTKALAQDQRAGLQAWIDQTGADIRTETYDGDTSPDIRRVVRHAGQIVITNPDMLHTGILPHHTKWHKLFENLRYVVIDELHIYRGVFGSHVANVLRRLQRICRFYGSEPTFVFCSATIANPKELAEAMIGQPVVAVTENGAPSGRRHFVMVNPPVVKPELGIRRSVLLVARDLAARLISRRIATIVFARSRLAVEVLLSYLRQRVLGEQSEPRERKARPLRIEAYRGGYLPSERRRLERDLRDGAIHGIVATNALELGIDIGSLDAAVLVGYPGSIASVWQQAGRAGRGRQDALIALIASSHPLDQYLAEHPDFFFGQAPEAARINPDNLLILLSHLKCAAFELPFARGDRFGGQPVDPLLDYLAEEHVVKAFGDRWYWMADQFPADDISLRSAAQANVAIIERLPGRTRVIGEIDAFSAPMLVHDQAIYLHQGRQYQVEAFDYQNHKAYVRAVDVDYYTDANLAVEIRVLDNLRTRRSNDAVDVHWGEVLVSAKPTVFKKIKLHTRENIGWGKIHLPEQEMHTTATWFELPDAATGALFAPQLQAGLHGLAHVLQHLAPLYVLADGRDIRAVAQLRSPYSGRPTIYLYDAIPGGVGLSDRLFEMHETLCEAASQLLERCACDRGCPACVGADAVVDAAVDAKAAAATLLAHFQQASHSLEARS